MKLGQDCPISNALKSVRRQFREVQGTFAGRRQSSDFEEFLFGVEIEKGHDLPSNVANTPLLIFWPCDCCAALALAAPDSGPLTDDGGFVCFAAMVWPAHYN